MFYLNGNIRDQNQYGRTYEKTHKTGRELGYSGADLQMFIKEEKAEIKEREKEQREREREEKEQEREERLRREAEEQERHAQLQLAKINADIEIARATKPKLRFITRILIKST